MPTRLLLEGPDIEALLVRVHAEHGASARIVQADRVRSGGVAGFFSKEKYEVEIEIEDSVENTVATFNEDPFLTLARKADADEVVLSSRPVSSRSAMHTTPQPKPVATTPVATTPVSTTPFERRRTPEEIAAANGDRVRAVGEAITAIERVSGANAPIDSVEPGTYGRNVRAYKPPVAIAPPVEAATEDDETANPRFAEMLARLAAAGVGEPDEDRTFRVLPSFPLQITGEEARSRQAAAEMTTQEAPLQEAPTPQEPAGEVSEATSPATSRPAILGPVAGPSVPTAALDAEQIVDAVVEDDDSDLVEPEAALDDGDSLEQDDTLTVDLLDADTVDSATEPEPVLPAASLADDVVTPAAAASVSPMTSPPSAFGVTTTLLPDPGAPAVGAPAPVRALVGASASSEAPAGTPPTGTPPTGSPSTEAPAAPALQALPSADALSAASAMLASTARVAVPAPVEPAVGYSADDDIAPVDPSVPVIPLTALTLAMAGLPTAPRVSAETGDVLVVVGSAASAYESAVELAAVVGVDPRSVLLASATRAGTGVPPANHLPDVEACRSQIEKLRTGDAPVVVAVDAPFGPTGTAWAREVLDSARATAIWAVVDATRKTGDVEDHLVALGGVDALIVQNASLTRDPGAILELGVPVASLDGRRATRGAWLSLLATRLLGDDE